MRIPRGRPDELKELPFLQAAYDDMMALPQPVRHDFGYGLYVVQRGETPDNASPFEGSTGATIMKLVERHETDTYRCVYAAEFKKAVYVLHVFQKKSTSGVATPKKDIDTVSARFRRAQELYSEEYG